MNLVFDKFHNGRPYPNLAVLTDLDKGYSDLGNNYPYIVPLRLIYYSADHNWPINIFNIDSDFPEHSFYPVGIGFFCYDVDYFALMSTQLIGLLRQNRLRVLFYYHEGDNPFLEKQRLDDLCQGHGLSTDCYRFVSGNTMADHIPGFVYFADHELFYWKANQQQPALTVHDQPRGKQFTFLSRTHKWWRATIATYLKKQGYLDNAYWSYNTISIGDLPEDNPIEIDRFAGLRSEISNFLKGCPYTCDTLEHTQHNMHHNLVPYHFTDSYCHLVMETLYDAEQSNGSFLTEKTFKPIKHGQPFVIFGTPNSLATLRQLGYRTFDHAISNDYDQLINNTERFVATTHTVERLVKIIGPKWFEQCSSDILQNQRLFCANKTPRLNTLLDKLKK